MAQSSANALLTLINDILDFSKIEAGKMELEFIDFNLRDELGKFAEATGFKAQEKGVELILDTTNVDTNIINSDPGRIRQILSNIVGNSVKFTEFGYILIKATLNTVDENNPRLTIEMSDSGIGIKEDKISTLFDSFSQADNSTTRKYGGTGLGLAIVKKLANLMDGEVYVTSEYGKGSTFTVDIGVNIPKNATKVLPDEIIKSKKILIVDRCKITLNALCNQLQHWDMQTDLADNEEVLKEKLKTASYDIIFLDMKITQDIDELLKNITSKNSFKDTKLVVMTPLKDRGDSLKFEQLGVDSTFPKPATTQDLFKALATLGGKKTYIQEKEQDTKIVWDDVNILLVEDNITNQIVANGILENFNLEADVANNGQEALDILNKNEIKYDIILMDCQMPIMDGYTASENIRDSKAGKLNKKIPIVAMTANAMQGDKEKCFSHGMDDYISKPIDAKKLQDTLKKWLPHSEEVLDKILIN